MRTQVGARVLRFLPGLPKHFLALQTNWNSRQAPRPNPPKALLVGKKSVGRHCLLSLENSDHCFYAVRSEKASSEFLITSQCAQEQSRLYFTHDSHAYPKTIVTTVTGSPTRK